MITIKVNEIQTEGWKLGTSVEYILLCGLVPGEVTKSDVVDEGSRKHASFSCGVIFLE